MDGEWIRNRKGKENIKSRRCKCNQKGKEKKGNGRKKNNKISESGVHFNNSFLLLLYNRTDKKRGGILLPFMYYEGHLGRMQKIHEKYVRNTYINYLRE